MDKKLLPAILCMVACCVVMTFVLNNPEKQAIQYFNNNRETLTEDAVNALNGEELRSDPVVTANLWDGEHPIVEYIVESRGMGSSTSYYGVFYSPDDQPAAFQNADVPLEAFSANVWEWHAEGDNHGEIRRLEPDWFYFEASF